MNALQGKEVQGLKITIGKTLFWTISQNGVPLRRLCKSLLTKIKDLYSDAQSLQQGKLLHRSGLKHSELSHQLRLLSIVKLEDYLTPLEQDCFKSLFKINRILCLALLLLVRYHFNKVPVLDLSSTPTVKTLVVVYSEVEPPSRSLLQPTWIYKKSTTRHRKLVRFYKEMLRAFPRQKVHHLRNQTQTCKVCSKKITSRI